MWACLLLCPVAVIVLAVPFLSAMAPSTPGLLLIGAMLILGAFTTWFARILRVRYSGTSLVLMTVGYFIGQIVLLAGLLVGACFILIMQL